MIVSTSINNMKMAFTLADNVDVEVTVLRFCSNFMEFGIYIKGKPLASQSRQTPTKFA